MIGLDTSAVIDVFKGNPDVKRFLESNSEPICATMMTYLELSFGLDADKRPHREEAAYYREFFSAILNFDLTIEACEKAASVYHTLRKAGKTIGQFDCVIAAIFLANGVTKILTRNVKDYKSISQMEVISY